MKKYDKITIFLVCLLFTLAIGYGSLLNIVAYTYGHNNNFEQPFEFYMLLFGILSIMWFSVYPCYNVLNSPEENINCSQLRDYYDKSIRKLCLNIAIIFGGFLTYFTNGILMVFDFGLIVPIVTLCYDGFFLFIIMLFLAINLVRFCRIFKWRKDLIHKSELLANINV